MKPLAALVLLFEHDDNVSFLVSGLRIPVSFGDLVQ
jgi:hypothetical protein